MNTLRRIAIGAALPIVVVVVYAVWAAANPSPYFPAPTAIAQRFRELWLFDRFMSDLVPSLVNLMTGWTVAVVVGILVGVLLGRVAPLRLMFAPLLDFGRSIPAIMLIPPLVLVLGIGDASKIAIIALGAFFPVALSTMDGLRQTDPALIDVTRALRLSRLKEIRVAWLPSAAPSIAGGMQTGLQFAFILMVASEMLAAIHGLGYLTMQSQLTFDSVGVWAGIVMLAILGFVINAIFVLVRDRLLAWNVAMRAAAHAR